MAATLLLAGTRKGLFTLRGGDGSWELDEPALVGWEVFHAVGDPRDGSLYACANNVVYGPTVHRSADAGRTWERLGAAALPERSGSTFARAWHVEPGLPDQPGRLWLGGDPGALFRSDDAGASWEPVAGILEHPTRERWHPGAGGLCCHSVTLDRTDGDRLWVGISAAGVFRSEDGGESWTPANAGTAADFLPDADPEVGQCVHKVLSHPAQPERLWQQNHCGVYRSDDGGERWKRLDGNGLPSDFGFPLALDPADPDVAYVVPEAGAENRVTPDGRLGVYRTDDAGASWRLAADGLPDPAWAAVMREGLASDGGGKVYLGTQSGWLWAFDGERWRELARHLPPVLSVEVAAWPS